ncbi:hypothetical protein AVMA1855_23930 [Acidovorax sp. SUPP1855]|uniref:hypothetical protein n=1 Tax=Acidovorax sp. SUPP1855 TaxID=431774 RepID=UPI0023DE2BBB|nr:hypothetical protein [Acidovorax sp. SUPP1855]GKS87260.1 hypothetical protein AVMA1855_23930 [Acidovorax sp. SUPP1855]
MVNPSLDATGVHLEYLFAKAAEFEMLGSPSGPFALRWNDEGIEQIAVFGGQLPPTHSSFHSDYAHVPLKMAQELGATLSVADGMAVCEIGSTRCVGTNYAEAVMRALIAHIEASSAESESAWPTARSVSRC